MLSSQLRNEFRLLSTNPTIQSKTSTTVEAALRRLSSVGYRDSPLSVGEADDGLAPGDRIADRLLPDGSRLFDHLRHTGATQLIRRNAPHILIRPDAYVAEIGPREVDSYHGEAVRRVEFD